MDELIKKASELVGRDVEVEKLKDGKYIVLFMSLTESPPPKGNTPEEAVKAFVEWIEKRPDKQLPEVALDDRDDDEDS